MRRAKKPFNFTNEPYNGPVGEENITYNYGENRLIEVDNGQGNHIKRIVDDGVDVTGTLYVPGMEIETGQQ